MSILYHDEFGFTLCDSYMPLSITFALIPRGWSSSSDKVKNFNFSSSLLCNRYWDGSFPEVKAFGE
jgi:hypothetical protein